MSAAVKTPRQKAEACFAVARSTTHDGERANAISRGTAICETHGLPLNDFDIPGRKRHSARETHARYAPNFKFSTDDLAEAIRAMNARMAREREAYEHARREMDRAAAEKRHREDTERLRRAAQHHREEVYARADASDWARSFAAAQFLDGKGFEVTPIISDVRPWWIRYGDRAPVQATDADLCDLARRVRAAGSFRP